MKIFLVDAGNTRIKWAIWNSADPVGAWAVRGHCPTAASAPLRTAAATAQAVEGGVSLGVYCSVAGEAASAEVDAALCAAGIGEVRRFRSVRCVGPLRNAYEVPEQLGSDRLAAALGAWQRVQADAIVVGAGTATTIDLLRRSDDGGAVFEGGVILPGLDLMLTSLARNTAGLPLASGTFRPIPGNTDDAIVSGCLQAQLGAVDRMRGLLPAGSRCVLGGGAASRLLPLLGPGVEHAPDLVLEGLAAAILHGVYR